MRLHLASAAAVAACFTVLCAAAEAGSPVNIALVPVGDAGNVADPATGYGSVSYAYSMGKYDVTMGQYTAFLNAVATATDSYGLYNTSMATATPTYGILRTSTSAGYSYSLRSAGSANVPVTFVDWGDACRFVNWLANGEPTTLGEVARSTEAGSYDLNGSTGSAALMAVTRSSTADWVLPDADEWYKAAYYAGGGTNSRYWFYPTQSNSMPSNVLSPTGTNNANFSGINGVADPRNLLTSVGFFAASPGPYGTFDMGGDVAQWSESPDVNLGGSGRYYFGGSWADGWDLMAIPGYVGVPATTSGPDLGFRVEYVPEPNSAAILTALGTAGLLLLCLRRSLSDSARGRRLPPLVAYSAKFIQGTKGVGSLKSLHRIRPFADDRALVAWTASPGAPQCALATTPRQREHRA